MATYTTAALVRKTVKNIDATLLDADLNAYIEEAESILDCIMGGSFIATFNATKHGILRSAANKWAAICCIIFNPSGTESIGEWSAMVDVLWDQWGTLLDYLTLDTVVRYLEGL